MHGVGVMLSIVAKIAAEKSTTEKNIVDISSSFENGLFTMNKNYVSEQPLARPIRRIEPA